MFKKLGLWLTSVSLIIGSVSALVGAELKSKPILLVLTNHTGLGDTGKRTGFFLSEAAHPWKVFKDHGYEVVLASPRGGFAAVDQKSFKLDDPVNAAFWQQYGSKLDEHEGVAKTIPLADVKAEDFSAVFYAGGHGAMWDFADDANVMRITAAIYEQGGAVGAVCHGPAALANVKLTDGTPLVKGKKIAVFTNEEEAAVELTNVVPFLLVDKLVAAGAVHDKGENFKENAVRDGRLVTGQNPASATKAAELLIEAMKQPQAFLFKDSGEIPNNPTLPLLIYKDAVPRDADAIEALFKRHGWRPAWRYSVFPYPHYHSTAHEILGVYRGSAKIRLGHSAGAVFEVSAGDVIVIPAGVGHENLGASDDFHVVGGYPPDQSADQMRGEAGERPAADENIAKVPLPKSDPVFGVNGPLVELWK